MIHIVQVNHALKLHVKLVYTYVNKRSTSKFKHLSLSTVRAGNVIGGGDWLKTD